MRNGHLTARPTIVGEGHEPALFQLKTMQGGVIAYGH